MDLTDFLARLEMLSEMPGGTEPLIQFLAKQTGVPVAASDPADMVRAEAMIRSMTLDERHHPETIDEARAARIGAGSGRTASEVALFVEQFLAMCRIVDLRG